MIIMLVLSFSLPFFTGYCLSRFCVPWQYPSSSYRILCGSLGAGLGLGLYSGCYLLYLLVRGSAGTDLVICDAGVVLIFVSSCKLISRGLPPAAARLAHCEGSRPKSNYLLILTILFSSILVLAVVTFLRRSTVLPHGGWDAWAVWNLHSRFLFRGGKWWTDAFSRHLEPMLHPDYPLLVSGIVARGWTYMGEETQVVPVLIAMLFTFATAGLLASSLTILKSSRSQGLLAGLTLLGTINFIILGSYQYADVPLSFFFLATIVLFCLQDKFPLDIRISLLAGLVTGLSSWTKNEGLLFLIATAVARCTVMIRSDHPRVYMKQILCFAAAVIPILALVVYFKVGLVPPNDVMSAQGFHQTFARLVDYARYVQTAKAFILTIADTVPLMLPVLFYIVFAGVELDKTTKTGVISGSITLSIMVVGYFGIYVITPYDVAWHLQTSLSRLVIQLWPSALFVTFMAVRTLEQVRKGEPCL